MENNTKNFYNYGVVNYLEKKSETKKRRKRTQRKKKAQQTSRGFNKLILALLTLLNFLRRLTIEQLNWGKAFFELIVAIIMFVKILSK